MSKQPIQPVELDAKGVLRFKANAIVRHLLDTHTTEDLNTLCMLPFSKDDREQFAQLIGYSVSGAGSLSYISDETYESAMAMHESGLSEKDARIAYLEKILDTVKEGLKKIAPSVFGISEEDLTP